MDHNSWQADSFSSGQEIRLSSLNLKVYFRIHQNLTLGPNLSDSALF